MQNTTDFPSEKSLGLTIGCFHNTRMKIEISLRGTSSIYFKFTKKLLVITKEINMVQYRHLDIQTYDRFIQQ